MTRDLALEIRLLGDLELLIRGKLVKLHRDRVRNLLALLAVNAATPVPFERIVNTLWEVPPKTAHQQVHNVVSQLRRALSVPDGQAHIVTSASAYTLSIPQDAVDVIRFQALVRKAEAAEKSGEITTAIELLVAALDEWRGPALIGFASQYVSHLGHLLNDSRYAAAERLAQLRMTVGRASESVASLTTLLAEVPLRESLRAALVNALHQAGRQADALAVYEEGRRILADELGLDPSAVLVDAQRAVLRGRPGKDVDQAPQASATTQSRSRQERYAPVGAGSYLPRDLAEFTGRADELQALVGFADDCDGTAPAIVIVDGMGGVGKTTLAVHVAHRLSERFNDGQYFVDLAGFSDSQPLSPLRALNVLLKCGGMPPELIPSQVQECSAAWRSLTAGRKVLLMLDNAASTAQIRPLLPSSGKSLVFISSRWRMPQLEGAAHLALDTMNVTDAMTLFSRVAGLADGGQPTAVRSVIELCGRLPLAIQIVAARLRARPSWSLEYLVEQLRDVKARARLLSAEGRDVMEILAWSYRQLPEGLKFAFRLLALIPGRDFDSYVIAASADVHVHTAQEWLEQLYDANLLNQDHEGRYYLHDLVRDCARELALEEGGTAEAEPASARLVGYYLRSAATWCAPIAKKKKIVKLEVPREPAAVREPADGTAAVELLDAEFENLSAAIRFAVDQGFPRQGWQLVSCLLPYFAVLNYTGETEALLEIALGAARAAHDQVGEMVIVMGLAAVKRARGFGVESRELIGRAIALSQQHADSDSMIWQLIDLGVSYMDDGLLDEARSSYLKAEQVAIGSGDKVAQSDVANNLAVVSWAAENLEEALQYFQRAYEFDREGGLSHASPYTVVNLAYVHCLLGDWNRAQDYYAEALAMSRATGSKPAEAFSLVGRCLVDRALRRPDEALEHGRAGLEVARELNLNDLESQALCAIGDVHLSTGDLAAATEVFKFALNKAHILSNEQYAARATEGLAHVHSVAGDTAKAAELWASATATWPNGIADRAGASRHLTSPQFGAAQCWRCALA